MTGGALRRRRLGLHEQASHRAEQCLRTLIRIVQVVCSEVSILGRVSQDHRPCSWCLQLDQLQESTQLHSRNASTNQHQIESILLQSFQRLEKCTCARDVISCGTEDGVPRLQDERIVLNRENAVCDHFCCGNWSGI